jgi:hypothetical protein
LFRTWKEIYRKGSTSLIITFGESYFKEAPEDLTPPSLRGVDLSLNAELTAEGKNDWLVNTGFITAASTDEPVWKFPLTGCQRALTDEKWEQLVAFIGSLSVIIPSEIVPPKVVREDGTIVYHEDIIRRHLEAEFTWAQTREGADGVIASGGRLYWYDQYGGINSDESYEEFLRRFRPEDKLYGTMGEVLDGDRILHSIRTHVLEHRARERSRP